MNNPSHFKGFKLIGLAEKSTPVVISDEEYAAIRLSDYELLNQVEAARIMGVSRPTYTHFYGIARHKVAEALVMGKTLVFQGEKVQFDGDWYSCTSCGSYFNHPDKIAEIKYCTMCGSSDIKKYNENTRQRKTEYICVCPKCGYEKAKSLGIPCKNEICNKCNGQMMRKGTSHYNRMIKNIKK